MKVKLLHIVSFFILVSVLSGLIENTFSFVNEDEMSELILEDEVEEKDGKDELEESFKIKVIQNQLFKFEYVKKVKGIPVAKYQFILQEYFLESKVIPVPPPELIG